MFWGKCSNNLMMKTYYRRLIAVYNTQRETYSDLLSGKTDIHTQNMQTLMKGNFFIYYISSLFYFGKNYTIVIEINLFTMFI